MRSVNLVTADADNLSTQVCASFVDGQIPEFQARKIVCENVFRAGVLHQVVKDFLAKRPTDSRAPDEILGVLAITFVEKSFAPPEKGGLDVVRIALGQSVCGWARQLLSKVVVTSARTAVNSLIPASTLTNFDDPYIFADLDLPQTTMEDGAGALSLLSGESGEFHPGYVARLVHGLPQTIRPRTAFDRFVARTAVETSDGAAHRSLMDRNSASAHEVLAPMWDDYSELDVQTLAQMSDGRANELCSLLIDETVSVAQRPNARTIAAFTRSAVGLSRRLGWSASVTELCHTYVCVDRTLVSERDRKTPHSEIAKRFSAASTWRALVERHRTFFPDTALGATTVELESTLNLLLNDAHRTG